MVGDARAVVVLGTLAGFLGTVGPGSAVALHVVLEHETTHRASGHAHHSGHGLAGDEGHRHESHLEVPDPGGAHMHREEIPAHRHALSLAGDLTPRLSRSPVEASSSGPTATPDALSTPVDRSPLLATQRAGPPPGPSPRSSRLVALRI